MDPITTMIVIALASGVAGGATQVGTSIIVDAYTALKDALKEKCGVNSKVTQALNALEEEPDFKSNQTGLAERISQAKVADDPKLVELAEKLKQALETVPEAKEAIDKYTVSIKVGNIGSHFSGNIAGRDIKR